MFKVHIESLGNMLDENRASVVNIGIYAVVICMGLVQSIAQYGRLLYKLI